MTHTPLTSREYKLTLKPRAFSGKADNRQVALADFADDLAKAAKSIDVRLRGRLDKAKAPRQIGFMDTANVTIQSLGYILRERKKADEREFTLKFRHPD